MADKLITRTHVIARLLLGAIYNDDGPYWDVLREETSTLSAYFDDMGVKLVVDMEMGMGFVRPLNPAEEEEVAMKGLAPIPKIIQPKTIGYQPSLLCALLRQALQQHEEGATEGNKYLYLDETQLIDLLRPYVPESHDAKVQKRELRKVFAKVEEIGVIHKVPNRSETVYRVEPIIRARIPIEQLQSLREQLLQCAKGDANDPDVATTESTESPVEPTP